MTVSEDLPGVGRSRLPALGSSHLAALLGVAAGAAPAAPAGPCRPWQAGRGRATGAELRGTLRVVSCRSVIRQFIPPALKDFARRHPAARVEVHDTPGEHDDIERMVGVGEADLGLGCLPMHAGLCTPAAVRRRIPDPDGPQRAAHPLLGGPAPRRIHRV